MTSGEPANHQLLQQLSDKAEKLYVKLLNEKKINRSSVQDSWAKSVLATKGEIAKELSKRNAEWTNVAEYGKPSANMTSHPPSTTRKIKIQREPVVFPWRKRTKLPEVSKLPAARWYSYLPYNVHVEDQKALNNIPYFDDETATDGNEFIQNIIDIHDGNIHSAQNIPEDDHFLTLIGKLNKSRNLASTVSKKPCSSSDPVDAIHEVVFEAIAHAFPSEGSVSDVKNRYARVASSSKTPTFNPNIDGPSAISADRSKSLHSYKSLFCRRCYIYDCHLHTKEMDLSPEKLSNMFIRQRENFIEKTPLPLTPCSDTCFMHHKSSSFSTDKVLTNADESIIKAEWVSSPGNFCLLKIFVDPERNVTCSMVYEWCKQNIKDFHPFEARTDQIARQGKGDCNGEVGSGESISFDDDSNFSGNSAASEEPSAGYSAQSHDKQDGKNNRSNRSKRKGASNRSSSTRKQRKSRNALHFIHQLKLKKTDVHNYSPCMDHIGEECTPKCNCIINGHSCEKYCLCSSKCQYRYPGCTCSGNCNTGQCPCFKASRECDPDLCNNCGAGDFPEPRKCCNIPIQRRKKKHLLIAPSDLGTEAGWGCFTKDNIMKNELISEYCGEIISQVEAERRGIIYDKHKMSYLFQLNAEFSVDATLKGNKIRFANHSQRPNCYAKICTVNGEHRIGIFAARDINEGEELFFDYKYGNTERMNFVPIEQHVLVNGRDPQITPKTLTNGNDSSHLTKTDALKALTVRNYATKSASKPETSKLDTSKQNRKAVF